MRGLLCFPPPTSSDRHEARARRLRHADLSSRLTQQIAETEHWQRVARLAIADLVAATTEVARHRHAFEEREAHLLGEIRAADPKRAGARTGARVSAWHRAIREELADQRGVRGTPRHYRGQFAPSAVARLAAAVTHYETTRRKDK